MIDSYITYEPNPAGEENSPGFFSKHVNEIFSYTFMETETHLLLPSNGFPPMNQPLPQENVIDQFSNDSAYSTNPSTKHSPEYTPNEEDQEGDNEKFVPSKVPPITRKGIKKQYEPILDNGILYRYEEDPNEYRKARKRIQNRESATRVRNRKRTRAEELEDEVKQLTSEKAELKVQNAALIAENNMLKQQVGLLERMISKNQEDMLDNTNSFNDVSRTEHSDSIINLMTKTDDEADSEQSVRCKYTRVSPSHNNFKRHVATLGVFTLLLCVYGLLPRTQTHSVSLFSTWLSRKPTLAVAVKTEQNMRTSDLSPLNVLRDHKYGDPGDISNWIQWAIELFMMTCYLAYFIYVSVSFYKYRALRKKAYVYSPL